MTDADSTRGFTRLAERYGTPLYVYHFDAMAGRLRGLRRALGGGVQIYYAVKANGNLRLLESLRPLLDGLDVSSGGEIRQAMKAGYAAGDLSFAGPGKTEAEIALALETGCGSISIENTDERDRIVRLSRESGKRARVSLRVNPNLLTKGFSLKMGGRPTQFGVDEDEAAGVLELIKAEVRAGVLEFEGYHVYSGTQCLDAEQLIENYRYTFDLVRRMSEGVDLPVRVVNVGGGLGIPYYGGDGRVDADRAARGLRDLAAERALGLGGAAVRMELGRYLVGEFGWYLSRVLATKMSRGKKFVIVDGGMHHNAAASGNLGQAIRKNYRIENVSRAGSDEALERVDIVGCLCTPVDLLATNLELPRTEVGDLICIHSSGAYGYGASPLLFLGHETPREVMVRDGGEEIIRERKEMSHFD